MRLLEKSIIDSRIYYEEKSTINVRGNNGYVLPNDAIFYRIGVNIVKYKHHEDIAEEIIKEQREEYIKGYKY